MFRLFATTAAIAALVAPPAYAADVSESGFYLGANAGVSRADTRKSHFDQVLVDALDFFGVPFSDGTRRSTIGTRLTNSLSVIGSIHGSRSKPCI